MRFLLRAQLPILALALAGAATAAAQSPVSVSGVVYGQYGYQFKDTGDTLNAHPNSFDVTRAYLNVKGSFADGVSGRVTADIYHPAGDNSLSYRLKYAYLQLKPNGSNLAYKFGLIHTPYVDWAEALWDYRMQGSIALDRNHYLTSADFGAGIDGAWKDEAVNMQVGVYNGEGYSGGAGDQRKDIEGRVSVRLMKTDLNNRVGGLRLTGFALYGKPTGGGQRQRFVGNLSYKSSKLLLAALVAATKDSSTAGATPEMKGLVISAFGVYNIPQSKAAIIARVDMVNPNTNAAAINDKKMEIIGGVSYTVNKSLRVLADIDHVRQQGIGADPSKYTTTSTMGLFQAEYSF